MTPELGSTQTVLRGRLPSLGRSLGHAFRRSYESSKVGPAGSRPIGVNGGLGQQPLPEPIGLGQHRCVVAAQIVPLHTEAVADRAVAPDGRVLYGSMQVARGKTSGGETQMRIRQVFWLLEKKVVRRQLFLDRSEALIAAGLEEADVTAEGGAPSLHASARRARKS
jgi:hypothetical protein